MKKRCAIIYVGSNDGYQADYLHRTSFAFNYNLSRLQGVVSNYLEFTIVFVDFVGVNSPLAESLPIYRAYEPQLRFLQVPRDSLRSEREGSAGFPIARLQNIAMRLVDADYFVHGATDLIGSKYFWDSFSKTVTRESDEERLLFVPRCYLPTEFLIEGPSLDELEYLMDEIPLPSERVSFAHGHAGFLCGSSAFFSTTRGFNESFSGYGNGDTEVFLFSSGYSTPKVLNSEGLRVFKLPYNQSGLRPNRKLAPVQPMNLTGCREHYWGDSPKVVAFTTAKVITTRLPTLPTFQPKSPRKMTIFYWFVSVIRHCRGFKDLYRAYCVGRAVRGAAGFSVASQGLSVAELLTICFWKRFAVILNFVYSEGMFDFVHFLHKLDRYLSTLDRLNTFRGVVVPVCVSVGLPESFASPHAHHTLFSEREILVICRSEDKLYLGVLSHARLLSAVRSDDLPNYLSRCP